MFVPLRPGVYIILYSSLTCFYTGYSNNNHIESYESEGDEDNIEMEERPTAGSLSCQLTPAKFTTILDTSAYLLF